MAHIAQYCTELSDENVRLICQICDKEGIAFTTLEFAHLLLHNNVVISREAFVMIARVLKNYKDIADEIPDLYRSHILAYKWNVNP